MREHWRLALISGCAFLLGAVASEYVVHQSSGLTAIWPCNAVTLAMLLLVADKRGGSAAVVIGAFLGSLISSVVRLQPPLLSLLFPVANTLESVIAAAMIRRLGGVQGAFDKVANVIALIVASILAPILPAIIGSGAIRAAVGGSWIEGFFNWYGAAMLGLAVITPSVITIVRLVQNRANIVARPWAVGEAVLLFALIAAAAIVVFDLASVYLSNVPLLFAIFPFVTLATFRLRQLGAVTAIVIVTFVGAQSTVSGIGPFASAASPAQELLFLQLFLAMTFLTALPVSAALAERDARAEEGRILAEQFRAVVENVDKVIFRLDREGRWTYLNPAWEEATGYSVARCVGQPWDAYAQGENPEEFGEWADPVLSGELVGSTRRMVRFRTADKGVRWMEISLQTLRDGQGASIGATGTMRDVDDRKRLEEHVLIAKRRAEERAREASLLAATDDLTGLANRRAFGRHLERLIETSRHNGWELALAIFDVDHFKQVNDRYGHAVGDVVLQRVAARALGVVRSGDVVGRLGGEEFGILMPGATLAQAHAAADRLRQAIQAPARDGEEELPEVTVSIGIAAAQVDQSAAALSEEADRALYGAKRDGRNRVQIAA